MNTFKRLMIIGIALTLFGLTIAGCANASTGSDQPVTSKLTEAQARQMIASALQAYNANDHAGYVRDMDDAMKGVLTEAGFKQLYDSGMQQYGKFISISKIALVKAQTPGFIRWDTEMQFEKVKLKGEFAFKQDGDKIAGARYEVIR